MESDFAVVGTFLYDNEIVAFIESEPLLLQFAGDTRRGKLSTFSGVFLPCMATLIYFFKNSLLLYLWRVNILLKASFLFTTFWCIYDSGLYVFRSKLE